MSNNHKINSLIKSKLHKSDFIKEAIALGIDVVSPGQVVPMVLRQDNSRFFIEVNEGDIVVGGTFN